MTVFSRSEQFSSSFSYPVGDLSATEARWFAVKVGHRKEKVIKKQLERVGVNCFLPLRDRPYTYASKTGTRRIPLLGGYLFVKIIRRQVADVHAVNHVFGFVKVGSEYRQVKPAEIDLLHRLSSDSGLDWVVGEQLPDLREGTPVEIKVGALAGVRGRYVRRKSKNTFVITFDGLDARLMTCEVSPDAVTPLADLTNPGLPGK